MARRCSHCGYNGHKSRTCLDMKGGFKLLGVRLSSETLSPASVAAESSTSSSAAMRKSFSMGNLCNYGSPEGGASPPSASPIEQPDSGDAVEGYASDDFVHTSSNSRVRKKGIPWTEEEHRSFLIGLQNLGKGDWRGISRNFVKSRTPTQVASHAQKYFLRQNNSTKRRRRSSLFDITPDTVSSFLGETVVEETGCDEDDDCPELSLGQNIPYGNSYRLESALYAQHPYPLGRFSGTIQQPSLTSATIKSPEMTNETNESSHCNDIKADEMGERMRNSNVHPSNDVDVMEVVPEVNEDAGRLNGHFPLIPMWPVQGLYGVLYSDSWDKAANIVRPTPIFPRPPAEVADDMVKISELSISTIRPRMEPTPLSYKLLEERSRQSAFHTMSQLSSDEEIDGQGNLSNAISVL